MSIQPFKSDAQLLRYASWFVRDRIKVFREDVQICMTANADRHHAYFPALITCIGFLDFLSGLHAGKFDSLKLPDLQKYIRAFFRRPNDYTHIDIFYTMFRHKIAHIAYPYLVFDTASKKLPPPRRRVTWTVGIYANKNPIELNDNPARKQLKTRARTH
jgi:hypothetical protein